MRPPHNTDCVNLNGKRAATSDLEMPPEVRARRSASSDTHGSVPSAAHNDATANDVHGTATSDNHTGAASSDAHTGVNGTRAAAGFLDMQPEAPPYQSCKRPKHRHIVRGRPPEA